MRIAMVGPFGLQPRSTMRVRALPLAKALVARGHSVHMLLPPWQNPEDAGRRWVEDGVAVDNIGLPSRIPIAFHVATAIALTRRTLAARPDVVHLFKPKAYSGLAHWLLARLPTSRRPRLVVDTDDWEGPGGWNDLAQYSAAQRRFFAWQERWGLTHADAVTVASRALESLTWALGVPRERVVYVPNGISGGSEQNRLGKVSGEPQPTILLYTRFFEFPVSRVIELLCRVCQAIPQVRLLVVGEGLFGEEKQLLQLAQEAGLAGAVDYAGWHGDAAMPAYLEQATLAIYPFDDTLVNRTKCPAKLLELMQAGVPVVAEAVGEIREVIRHRETGWLVEPGDVKEFAQAVAQLLQDAALRERLVQGIARDLPARRSWDQLAVAAERAYEETE